MDKNTKKPRHCPKIFGIGLNKTGTTTLGLALTELGFSHRPWDPGFMNKFNKNKIRKLLSITDAYDAFTDWPWPLMVEALLDEFGESAKFILTLRQNEHVWLQSLKKQSEITPWNDNPRKSIFGYRYPHENEMHHLQYYSSHTESVRYAFEKRGFSDSLLEVCWDTGDSWEKLCQFLDCPIPRSVFPHGNASSEHAAIKSTTDENKMRIDNILKRPWYEEMGVTAGRIGAGQKK